VFIALITVGSRLEKPRMKIWGLIKGSQLLTTGNLEALGLSKMTILHVVGFLFRESDLCVSLA